MGLFGQGRVLARLPCRSSRAGRGPAPFRLQCQSARKRRQPIPPSAPAPRPVAVQPFAGAKPPMPQPILPRKAALTAVQPHSGNAFALPADFTLKPRGSGRPLPEAIQRKMEAFFNASFADVRVHVGHEASSIGALAFTHGTDLYFAPGQYNPQSTQGQQLLAHELTHVIQQRAGRVRNPLGSNVAVVQDPALEAEAERTGHDAARFRDHRASEMLLQACGNGGGPVPATPEHLRSEALPAHGGGSPLLPSVRQPSRLPLSIGMTPSGIRGRVGGVLQCCSLKKGTQIPVKFESFDELLKCVSGLFSHQHKTDKYKSRLETLIQKYEHVYKQSFNKLGDTYDEENILVQFNAYCKQSKDTFKVSTYEQCLNIVDGIFIASLDIIANKAANLIVPSSSKEETEASKGLASTTVTVVGPTAAVASSSKPDLSEVVKAGARNTRSAWRRITMSWSTPTA